jgi:hypothetical protein
VIRRKKSRKLGKQAILISPVKHDIKKNREKSPSRKLHIHRENCPFQFSIPKKTLKTALFTFWKNSSPSRKPHKTSHFFNPNSH